MTAPPTRIASCPSREQLEQLHAGAVDESEADRLFAHIETCVRCQHTFDCLDAKELADVPAARLLSTKPPQSPQVEDLVRKAQQLGRAEKASTDSSPVSLDAFVSGLRRCGLFDDEEIDGIVTDLHGSDSSSMARVLVGRRQLTPFQARVLLKGKWKGLVLGNYVILDRLGKGGMGSVFRARHKRLSRIVCVKVMNSAGRKSPEMMERFRNEARTIASLNHPNFVVAHDADESEGIPFLVMEYIEGQDLARQVAADGPLPIREALTIIQQAAEALQYAHDQGITHRDIKPHNLLLTSESNEQIVKILDMGLARFDSLLNEDADGSAHAAITNTGVIMGTVDYMAPEQALRSRDADNRSDIYSLGCTLHFLATGRPVFDGDTIMARLVAHREAAVPSLEGQIGVPLPHLDAVFRTMLEKDPADRYDSMAAVARDVEALLKGRRPSVDVQARSNPVSELTRRPTRQAPGMWMMMTTFVVAFLLGALVMSIRPATAPDSIAASTEDSVPSGPDDATELTDGESESANQSAVNALPNADGFAATAFDHLETIGHGGTGRCLLLIPFQQFDSREADIWRTQFESQGVTVVSVSTQPGRPNANQDSGFVPDISRSILNVRADEFDFIVLVDGSTDEFLRPKCRGAFESLLGSAAGQGRIFATASRQAQDLIAGLLLWDRRQLISHMPGHVAVAKTSAGGHVLSVANPKQITDAVGHAIRLRRLTVKDEVHPDTMAYGGPGRALILLPMKGFSEKDFATLRRSLAHAGIAHEIASSAWGEAVSDRGSKVATTINASQFRVQDYDFVVLIGGPWKDLPSAAERRMSEIIGQSISNQVAVAATSASAGNWLQQTAVPTAEAQPFAIPSTEVKRQIQRLTKGDPASFADLIRRMVACRNAALADE